MKTFADYISEAKREPLTYWVEINRSNGNNEAVLYGTSEGRKDEMLARIINVARTIKLHPSQETAKMTSNEYVKAYYGKHKLCGNVDSKTRFCILLYNGKMSSEALLPLSSLKGCENEVKKCIAKISGKDVAVQKLPAAILRSMEM